MSARSTPIRVASPPQPLVIAAADSRGAARRAAGSGLGASAAPGRSLRGRGGSVPAASRRLPLVIGPGTGPRDSCHTPWPPPRAHLCTATARRRKWAHPAHGGGGWGWGGVGVGGTHRRDELVPARQPRLVDEEPRVARPDRRRVVLADPPARAGPIDARARARTFTRARSHTRARARARAVNPKAIDRLRQRHATPRR